MGAEMVLREEVPKYENGAVVIQIDFQFSMYTSCTETHSEQL